VLTGNKGEWSELYALFKILSDKKIYAGDATLNRIENLMLPIIKILRHESNREFEFSYDGELILVKNNHNTFSIPINKFKEKAIILLSKIKEKTDATFSVPEIEEFINSFNSNGLKAKSTNKSDIKIIIHDQRTGGEPELGFSIKSQLGSASTLLNPGKTTNFIYKISNLNISKIEKINSIDTIHKVQDRLYEIQKIGGKITFKQMENKTFENNLILIDSALPNIISELIILAYTSKLSKISDLTSNVHTKNPLNFNISDKHPFYSYKIKRLLTDIALGMTPSKVWNGILDATGGYLIVKETGEIVCYHIYNRNEFENYLFANTRLITPSTKRYNFGYIYQENNSLYIKLNLQIRFIK